MMTSEKLRVCHLSSVHKITDTRVFHRQCASMAQSFDVHLVAIGNFNGQHKGVNIIGIAPPKNRILRFLISTWKVFFHALRINAKLYHIHDGELLPIGIMLRILGKKIIYDIHENTYQDFANKPWIPKPLKSILATLYRITECFSAHFMHFVLVIARPEFSKRFCAKNYTIIQNFADTSQLAPYVITKRSVLDGNNIFYMGTVHGMYYNFNAIVEALYLLKKAGIEAVLHVAGESEFYESGEFRHQLWYSEVCSMIKFYGLMPAEDAYKLSMNCKVGICLKNQPEAILMSHERKFFEYMALGMPVICANSHIYKDVLKKYPFGIPVDLEDPFAIATALKKILTSDVILDRLGESAIQAASEYNWQNEAIKLQKLYTQLLN